MNVIEKEIDINVWKTTSMRSRGFKINTARVREVRHFDTKSSVRDKDYHLDVACLVATTQT